MMDVINRITLLLLIGLAFWGCEFPQEEEITQTEVTLWGKVYIVENTTKIHYYGTWDNLGQLTGTIPPEIGNLTNLTQLILNDNQLTGTIPPEIGNLTNLTKLQLQNNQLTGEIPSEIGNLTNLEFLWLSNNQLTGEIPSEIGNLTNLTDLDLYNNQLTGEIPETICYLNLDWDWSVVHNNQLCPPYPSCIENYVEYQDTGDCP